MNTKIADIRRAIEGLESCPARFCEDLRRCKGDATHREYVREIFIRRIKEVEALNIPVRFAADRAKRMDALVAGHQFVSKLDAMEAA